MENNLGQSFDSTNEYWEYNGDDKGEKKMLRTIKKTAEIFYTNKEERKLKEFNIDRLHWR